MEHIILNFNYQGQETIMQIQRNENMKVILKRYANRINKDINNIYFLINGNRLNSNLELETINHKYNKINLSVFDISKKNNNEKANQKEFKDIICPKCGENYVIEIKDYKVNLNKCDNRHDLNNMLLDEYNSIQIINEIKKNKCNICNKKNMKYLIIKYISVILAILIYVYYVNLIIIKIIR